MKLITPIKLIIANFFFQRDFSLLKRDVIVNNMEDAMNVGVLFYADSEENYRIVSRFALQLKKEGVKEVKMLGYVKDKNLPSYLSAKLGQDYFMKKDLNWHLKPVSTTVLNFIYEPFDIFIDLTTENIFPLKYIMGMSRAHFKVGKSGEDKNILLDMMINTNSREGLEYLSKNIIHYLKQINKVDGDVIAMLK